MPRLEVFLYRNFSNIYRGYYTAARRYDFLSSSGENNILRTSAASE